MRPMPLALLLSCCLWFACDPGQPAPPADDGPSSAASSEPTRSPSSSSDTVSSSRTELPPTADEVDKLTESGKLLDALRRGRALVCGTDGATKRHITLLAAVYAKAGREGASLGRVEAVVEGMAPVDRALSGSELWKRHQEAIEGPDPVEDDAARIQAYADRLLRSASDQELLLRRASDLYLCVGSHAMAAELLLIAAEALEARGNPRAQELARRSKRWLDKISAPDSASEALASRIDKLLPRSKPKPADPKPGAKPTPTSGALIDAWYGQYHGPHKMGSAHILATRLADGGVKVVESYVSRRRSSLTQQIYTSRTTFTAEMDEDLTVRKAVIKSVEADGKRSSTVTAERQQGSYLFTAVVGDSKPYSSPLVVEEKVIGSNDVLMQRLTSAGTLVKGYKRELLEFYYDAKDPKINRRTLEVADVIGEGKDRKIIVMFGVTKVTVAADGVVELLQQGAFRMKRESKEDAQNLPMSPPQLQDKIMLDWGAPNVSRLTAQTLEVTVRGYEGDPIFQASEYSKVEVIDDDPSRYLVTMTAFPRGQEQYPKLGFETKGKEAYLKADPIRQSDSPLIKAKAKEIIGGTTDSLEAVEKLAAWIHINLRKEYTAVGNLSATQCLAEMRGDCSEHAVLFDSFARSLGIPVKQCSGYVFFATQGGSHAWSQVWLGERWIHVDCVANTVGCGPNYILFWKQRDDGKVDRTTGLRRGALTAFPVTARVRSVTIGGKSVPRAKLDGLAKLDGQTLTHALMGVKLELPKGWRVTSMRPTRISLADPQGSTVSLRSFGNHPLAILSQQGRKGKIEPSHQVDGRPAWSMSGWSPMVMVAFSGGSLLVQGRSGKLDELLKAIDFDLD